MTAENTDKPISFNGPALVFVVLIAALVCYAAYRLSTNNAEINTTPKSADAVVPYADSPLAKTSTTTSVKAENRAASTSQETAKHTNSIKLPMTNENAKVTTGAVISTTLGDIEIQFLETKAPKTVANFVSLAATNFYSGIKFHRVIDGFMIQVGDPLTKNDSQMAQWGTGGPGYKFADELSGSETYEQGVVAMANSGPNTNGSQFFIMTGVGVNLPPSYTVFGKVTKGIDVAVAISKVKTTPSDRPVDSITIKSVTLK